MAMLRIDADLLNTGRAVGRARRKGPLTDLEDKVPRRSLVDILSVGDSPG